MVHKHAIMNMGSQRTICKSVISFPIVTPIPFTHYTISLKLHLYFDRFESTNTN